MRPVVLVVDDDRDTNLAITELLMAEDYSCLPAFDGAQGLALLGQQVPDIVLLDLNLPVIDGAEFLRRKAGIPELNGVPVIVITAVLRPPRFDNVVAMLQKPFGLQELLDTIGRFVPERSAGKRANSTGVAGSGKQP